MPRMNAHDVKQRELAAIHEAGHAVAAVMRGGSTLTSVSLSDQHGEGITWSNSKPCDSGFGAYAGPWAEARHLWGDRPLDAEDENGCAFGDVVMGVLWEQQHGTDLDMWRRDAAEHARVCELVGVSPAARDEVWDMELSRVWPAVQSVGALLLAGETVTDVQVRALVEGVRA